MTLLELAVVTVIIGILASLLLPVYSGHVARSGKIQCLANLRNIYVAASAHLEGSAGVNFEPFGVTANAYTATSLEPR